MGYRTEEKSRIDRILEAFGPELEQIDDIDLVYSNRMGIYLLLFCSPGERIEAQPLYSAEEVLEDLLELSAQEEDPEQGASAVEAILARMSGEDRRWVQEAWEALKKDRADGVSLGIFLRNAPGEEDRDPWE